MPSEKEPTARSVRERWEQLLRDIECPRPGVLRCEECGRVDDGERGWTLRVGDDDGLYAFCPECDEEEFGDA